MMPRACTGRRLSIVVPVTGDTAALEETLVSVLENRPADTEVIVGLGCDYADPWHIAEEVTFVAAPRRGGLVGCVNGALAAATGTVVHVLAAGWRATPGWTDAAVERIVAGEADAVIPVTVAEQDRARIVGAGLRVTAGGRRVAVVARRGAVEAPAVPVRSPVGPVLEAGFWSRDVLSRGGPGFAATCATLADADLAVALSRAGATTVIEPTSQVLAPVLPAARVPAFVQGLHAERLFWRSRVGGGGITAHAAHAWEVLRHTVTTAPLGTVPMLLGRLVAAGTPWGYRSRHRHLESLVAEAQATALATIPIGGRADEVPVTAQPLRRSA